MLNGSGGFLKRLQQSVASNGTVMNKGCYFIVLCALVFVFSGCSKRLDKNYYRNMNLCYSNLKSVYSEISLGVINAGAVSNVLQIAEASNKYQSFKCPVTEMRYAINPDYIKWKKIQSTNVAVICRIVHPDSISSERYYLTISFDGKLDKVTSLPEWAQSK